MVATFQVPVPDSLQQDPDSAEYFRALNLFINDLVAPEGVIATGTATAEVVLTQQEKLDLMTISQDVNLDTVEAQAQAATDALAVLQNSLPAYSITNDGTDRTINVGDIIGLTFSNPPTQAELEAFQDLVVEFQNFACTMNRDLQNKDIFG